MRLSNARISILLFANTFAGADVATLWVAATCAAVAALLMPNINRFVRESGRPVPRHVATSITEPCDILPITSFWPSGKSITNGVSEIGKGRLVTTGAMGAVFFLAMISPCYFHSAISTPIAGSRFEIVVPVAPDDQKKLVTGVFVPSITQAALLTVIDPAEVIAVVHLTVSAVLSVA